METVNKIYDANQPVMGQIVGNCGLNAINDTKVVAVFIAAHMKTVETTPEELKEIDKVMKNLVETGFAEGSMGCTLSEQDFQELF